MCSVQYVCRKIPDGNIVSLMKEQATALQRKVELIMFLLNEVGGFVVKIGIENTLVCIPEATVFSKSPRIE